MEAADCLREMRVGIAIGEAMSRRLDVIESGVSIYLDEADDLGGCWR
jgi:hypothetical protein